MKKLSTGVENFKVVSKECYYIDKTLIIRDIIKRPSNSIFLFTRPRRFGKSLTISMIQTFFEKSETTPLEYFKGTKITEYKDILNEYMGKFEIIHLNMKDLSSQNPEDLILKTKELITRTFNEKKYILNNLEKNDIDLFNSYFNIDLRNDSFTYCLLDLTNLIYKATKLKVIILIDEYDTPMQSAYEHDYFDKVSNFYKDLFSKAFKGNNQLTYGILTGVSKAGQLSLFSGFNNANVYTILDNEFSEYFGFTKEETVQILKEYKLENEIDLIEQWYGGYKFGNFEIFNPWSILKFCETSGNLDNYWNSTSSTSLIGKLISNNYLNMAEDFNKIINNEDIIVNIENTTNYQDINTNRNTILSFLLFLGYLKVKSKNLNQYIVSLTNQETQLLFSSQFQNIFLNYDSFSILNEMKESFLKGEEIIFNNLIEKYLLSSLSYYDFNSEKNYQIMLLTLFSIIFSSSIVKSEANCGEGRSDIIIINPDKSFAAIIEIKHITSRTTIERLKKSSDIAFKQIINKEYYKEISKLDIKNIYAYGIAFSKSHAQTTKKKLK